MRPKSIVLFERIVLASIGLGILSLLMSLEMLEMVSRITGAGMGILLGVPLLIFMIYGLLVYFVARKGSNAARWIYVVLAGLGLLWGLANLGTLTSMPAHIVLLTLGQHALTAASLFMLFQADSNAWFAQGGAGAGYGTPGGWPNQAPPGAGAWPAAPAPAPDSWPPQGPQQAGGWPPHAAPTPPVQAPGSTWPPAAPAAPSG
ncbi:MAG: hypothetical protein QOC65_656, partial [Sphingomonadales bacterium]|nr:hypothetical protein [Sphingomonadales bacterium]